MKYISWRVESLATAAALALAFGVAQPLPASDPSGIYALVDKVVLEPNQQSPERIQIWGGFVLSKAKSRNEYESPMRGYLYFSLPAEKPELAKTQWTDLNKIAGTGQSVGLCPFVCSASRTGVNGKGGGIKAASLLSQPLPCFNFRGRNYWQQ